MNKGGELLLKKTEWVSPARLIGDRNLATEPVIEKAFERILDQWKPASSIALLGLCTSTRPYSSTDTWKMFTRAAATDADPIITSNGGIIPIAFENQYPFLTYNAPAEHDAECDRLYIEVMTRRLKTFLDRFKYKAVIAAYLPKKRNRIAVEAACKATGTPYSIIIKPWQWAEMSQMVPCSRDAAKKTQMYKLTHMRNPIAYPRSNDGSATRLDSFNPRAGSVSAHARTTAEADRTKSDQGTPGPPPEEQGGTQAPRS